MDLKRIAKHVAARFHQYLGRLSAAERYLRGTGIEIGALQDPLKVGRGVRVRYLDVAPTEELRRRYPEKRRRHLVEVDIVDDGERMATVADDSQDFVIANHFLEHCQDPVGALRNMLRVVRSGGVVYLTIPDRTRMFDRDRPATTLEHVLRDHEDGPECSRGAHYQEVVRLQMKVQGEAAVAEQVRELMAACYPIHFHCWSQPELFELLVALHGRSGFPAFAVEHFARNDEELLVVLRRAVATGG